MAKAKKINYIYAVGRRKEASAQVRLFKGKGENLVNGKPIDEYFQGKTNEIVWSKPFVVTETFDNYYVTVRVVGGGLQGQLDATALGIARALVRAKPDKFKKSLRNAGLLTRDARERQRRMVGTGGKARRKKQSPKR